MVTLRFSLLRIRFSHLLIIGNLLTPPLVDVAVSNGEKLKQLHNYQILFSNFHVVGIISLSDESGLGFLSNHGLMP